MKKERSIKFLFSARPDTEAGGAKIDAARAIVRSTNAQAKESGSDVRLKIMISPRKGDQESSPHAWKYRNKDMIGKKLRREDYDHVDVYMVRTHASSR